MQNNKILEKYSNLILGDRYDSKNFFVDDFTDFEKLQSFIGKVESAEANFTKRGLEFLEEYYGIENLARMLYEDDPEFPGKSIEENIQFFYNFRPSV
ncbi:hypothetical protein HZA87_00890 [Candidatus Uhrbacteria bacterium]|nr:hypothetical protein [Candidatus Uhrbacteria bacterium]